MSLRQRVIVSQHRPSMSRTTINLPGAARRTLKRRTVIASVLVSPFALLAQRRPVLELSVLSNGVIVVNGSLATLQDLDQRLAKLKEEQGVVWYYREDPASPPTPQSTEALKLVLKYELPLSFSTKDDFSDYIDQEGKSRPRRK